MAGPNDPNQPSGLAGLWNNAVSFFTPNQPQQPQPVVPQPVQPQAAPVTPPPLTRAQMQQGAMLAQKQRMEQLLAMQAADPDSVLSAHRYDPKRNVETLPTLYNKPVMNSFLDAYKAAGIKGPSPQDLAAMALVEGRSDFGYNKFDTNNKKAVKVYNDLIEQGHNKAAAGFAAAVVEKQQVAKRKNIPFFAAWNGTGTSKMSGKTGFDYADKVERAKAALSHPKNKALSSFINTKLSEADLPEAEVQAAKGGAIKMPDGYKAGGNVKLI